jgi:hypothetical protein
MRNKIASNKNRSRSCSILSAIIDLYRKAFIVRKDKKEIGFVSRDGYFLPLSSEDSSGNMGVNSKSAKIKDN